MKNISQQDQRVGRQYRMRLSGTKHGVLMGLEIGLLLIFVKIAVLVINTKLNEVVSEVVSPGSHNIMPAFLPP